jgi:probable HAF family extracellular repeat protein
MKFLTALLAAGVLNGSNLYTIVDLGPSGDSSPQSLSSGAGFLPGGSWSATYGINASGEAVGYGDIGAGDFRAFTWTQSSGITMLGTLGGVDSWGMAIDDSGEVAGHSTTASGYVHAFADDGGSLEDLGTLGGLSSYAYGIDNSGTIVGYSTLSDGGTHAFVFLNGVMFDLNNLIPTNSGWTLNEAFSIDNAGQIFGEGVHNGQFDSFRLDAASFAQAVPEPSTFILFGIGFVVLKLLSQRSFIKLSNARLRHRLDKNDVVGQPPFRDPRS